MAATMSTTMKLVAGNAAHGSGCPCCSGKAMRLAFTPVVQRKTAQRAQTRQLAIQTRAASNGNGAALSKSLKVRVVVAVRIGRGRAWRGRGGEPWFHPHYHTKIQPQPPIPWGEA